MAEIELKMEKPAVQRAAGCPFVSLLCLWAGVFGSLFFFDSLYAVSFSGWIVYPFAFLFASLLWYLCSYQKKFVLKVFLMLVCLSGGSGILLYGRLRHQLEQVMDSILGKAGLETMEITETALLLTVIISLCFSLVEFILHIHAILYLLTFGLLLLSPLVGIRAGMKTILLFVVFQSVFWVIDRTVRGGGKQPLFLPDLQRLSEKSAQVMLMIVAACFLAALPLAANFEQNFYHVVYGIEGYIYRSLQHISGKEGIPVTGGKMNRGNQYHTGADHLQLRVSRRPEENLYLREFSGGEYLGDDWTRSSDEALFSNMEEELQWKGWEYMIRSMYYSMYFALNSKMQTGESLQPITLTVKQYQNTFGHDYVPYYSHRPREYDEHGYGADGKMFQFYEQKDMNIIWDNVPAEFEGMRDYYYALLEAYIKEAKAAYTQVPKDQLPQLTKFVAEHPMESLDEITAFILYTLNTNAVYTKTPGQVPMNRDIVEYFLFDSGQGYCQHFAATATLLYRLYGIPARYATGYMVSPSDFELEEDGIWHAVVTDESAHAWTEIFLEDYGWTPIEATPGTDGSIMGSYPGFGSEELQKLLKERKWNIKTPSITREDTALNPSVYSTEHKWSIHKIDLKKYEKAIWILGSCLIYSLLLAPIFLDYHRLWRLKKMETMNCRRVFDKFINMLHATNYLSAYDGTEEDFAVKLKEVLPSISQEELIKMQKIVSMAAYSFQSPTWEEEECVRGIYVRAAGIIYETLNWRQKLWFRYWKTFG